jgi:peptidoglycan/LPS O-acetylase OafA/YrhL
MATPPPLQPALLDNRYPALHGLRTVAICGVILHHTTFLMTFQRLELPWAARWVSHMLWSSLDFLFVLSGFLIGALLLARLDQRQGQPLSRFYTRRAFRIFPMYYLTLVGLSLLPADWRIIPRRGIAWQEWVYLTNYPYDERYSMYWSWSLSVEEHFYLLCPWLVLALFRLPTHAWRLTALLALWLSCQAIKVTTLVSLWGSLSNIVFFQKFWAPTHIRFDTLLAGVMAAYLHRAWPTQLERLFRPSWVRWGTLLLVVGVLALGMSQFSTMVFSYGDQVYWATGAMLLGTSTSPVFALLILWAVAAPRGTLLKLLSHPGWRVWASLSYGMYLIHIPVLEAFAIPLVIEPLQTDAPLLGWALGFAVAVLASTVAAYLMHLLVEKPMLRLRDRWAP